MVIRRYRYNGADMIHESLNHPNYVATDGDNLYYLPSSPPLHEQNGYASHTHHPLEGSNVIWLNVNAELSTYTTTSPTSFSNTLQLYGLNDNHSEELIGEQIWTTCTSPTTTEIVGFDLRKSATHPPLYKDISLTSAGTIRVNLPMRYSYYEDIKLVWGAATPISMAATPADDDLYITFTTPATWVESSPAYLSFNEYDNVTTTTNTVSVKAKDTLILGYDGLDKYDALRVRVDTTCDYSYDVVWNYFEYVYEVI